MTECDKFITGMDIVSTKETIATSVTSTASNCHIIKIKYCYILGTVLLEIILLLIIIIACYAKQKVIYKMENNELKKVRIKIERVIISILQVN